MHDVEQAAFEAAESVFLERSTPIGGYRRRGRNGKVVTVRPHAQSRAGVPSVALPKRPKGQMNREVPPEERRRPLKRGTSIATDPRPKQRDREQNDEGRQKVLSIDRSMRPKSGNLHGDARSPFRFGGMRRAMHPEVPEPPKSLDDHEFEAEAAQLSHQQLVQLTRESKNEIRRIRRRGRPVPGNLLRKHGILVRLTADALREADIRVDPYTRMTKRGPVRVSAYVRHVRGGRGRGAGKSLVDRLPMVEDRRKLMKTGNLVAYRPKAGGGPFVGTMIGLHLPQGHEIPQVILHFAKSGRFRVVPGDTVRPLRNQPTIAGRLEKLQAAERNAQGEAALVDLPANVATLVRDMTHRAVAGVYERANPKSEPYDQGKLFEAFMRKPRSNPHIVPRSTDPVGDLEKVKGYLRKTKSGKTVQVSGYTRRVERSLADELGAPDHRFSREVVDAEHPDLPEPQRDAMARLRFEHSSSEDDSVPEFENPDDQGIVTAYVGDVTYQIAPDGRATRVGDDEKHYPHYDPPAKPTPAEKTAAPAEPKALTVSAALDALYDDKVEDDEKRTLLKRLSKLTDDALQDLDDDDLADLGEAAEEHEFESLADRIDAEAERRYPEDSEPKKPVKKALKDIDREIMQRPKGQTPSKLERKTAAAEERKETAAEREKRLRARQKELERQRKGPAPKPGTGHQRRAFELIQRRVDPNAKVVSTDPWVIEWTFRGELRRDQFNKAGKAVARLDMPTRQDVEPDEPLDMRTYPWDDMPSKRDPVPDEAMARAQADLTPLSYVRWATGEGEEMESGKRRSRMVRRGLVVAVGRDHVHVQDLDDGSQLRVDPRRITMSSPPRAMDPDEADQIAYGMWQDAREQYENERNPRRREVYRQLARQAGEMYRGEEDTTRAERRLEFEDMRAEEDAERRAKLAGIMRAKDQGASAAKLTKGTKKPQGSPLKPSLQSRLDRLRKQFEEGDVEGLAVAVAEEIFEEPFKSERQRRWMWAKHPKMARKWERHGKRRHRRRQMREAWAGRKVGGYQQVYIRSHRGGQRSSKGTQTVKSVLKKMKRNRWKAKPNKKPKPYKWKKESTVK